MRSLGIIAAAGIMILVLTVLVVFMRPAHPEQRDKKSISITVQCRTLERLGKWAQRKLDEGYKPTERQMATVNAKIVWYQRNCS